MTKMKNYYDILGLKETATEKEIKARYKELKEIFGLDAPHSNARLFGKITEAYHIVLCQLPKKSKVVETPNYALQRVSLVGRLSENLNLRGAVRFAAGILAGVMMFSMSGCSFPEFGNNVLKEQEVPKDRLEDYADVLTSLMEKYKQSAFVTDYGFYSDFYPEFYVGNRLNGGIDGVLMEDLGVYITPTNYFLKIIDMYDAKDYSKEEDGTIVFKWPEDSDIDTTIFSYHEDDFQYGDGYKLRELKFEDVKDGKVVNTHTVSDNIVDVTNKVVIERDLSSDVHVTMTVVHFEKDDNSAIFSDNFKNNKWIIQAYNTDIVVNYKSQEYAYTIYYTNYGDGRYDKKVCLPSGRVSRENQDIDECYELRTLISSEYFYENGTNARAIEFFEKLTIKDECLELFSKGLSTNPWYEHVQALIDNGDYAQALTIMKGDSVYWTTSEKKLEIQPK